MNDALEEIKDIQQVILGFKGEPEPGTIAQEMVKEVFPDSTVQAPPTVPQTGSEPAVKYIIKDPGAPATEKQRQMISTIQARLGRANVIVPSELNKAQASAIIRKLLAEEGGKK